MIILYLRMDPEFIERFDNFVFDEVVNQEGQELGSKANLDGMCSKDEVLDIVFFLCIIVNCNSRKTKDFASKGAMYENL